MLMIPGGLPALRRFCKAMNPPKVVVVSAHVIIRMAAFGAAALDHSASRIASPSRTVGTRIGAVIGTGGRRWMNLSEGTAAIAGESQDVAERCPVGRAIDIAIFNQNDRLALA